MVPESGASRPVRRRTVVVLPAPFGPRSPKTAPRSTCIDRSTITRRPEMVRLTASALITRSSAATAMELIKLSFQKEHAVQYD